MQGIFQPISTRFRGGFGVICKKVPGQVPAGQSSRKGLKRLQHSPAENSKNVRKVREGLEGFGQEVA